MSSLWAAAQLITATKLNEGLFFKKASIALLEGIDTTLFTDNVPCQVPGYGIYLFDSGSSETADGAAIVEPATGGGRWILRIQEGSVGGGSGSSSSSVTNDYLLKDRVEKIEKDINNRIYIESGAGLAVYETGLFDETIAASSVAEYVFRINNLESDDVVFSYVNFENEFLSVVNTKIEKGFLFVRVRNTNVSGENIHAIPLKFIILKDALFNKEIERVL